MSAHTIEAILTARDQNMSSTFDKISGKADSFGAKLKSGLGFGMWSAIGTKAINTISNLIGSSMDGAVKRFDTLNNFPKVMKSLGFGAKEAEASINKLGDGIAHLPTTLDNVASQTQQFVAITGDLDKATRLTLALNNAMASGGAPAEQQASAINQFAQALSKGKPDLQDWRALVQTAPAQMNQLSVALLGAGKNQADLYEAMKSGTVTMDQVTAKMIEMSEKGASGFTSWEEQAKNAGAGIQMSLTNVKAGVQRNLANIMGGIDSLTSKWGGIAGIIQSIVPAFDKVGSTITDILTNKISIGEGITSLMTSATTLITNGLSTLESNASQMVNVGGQIITALVNGLGKNLPKLIAKAGSMILSFIGAIGKALPKLIVTGLNALTNLVKGLNNGTPSVLNKALAVGADIVVAILKALPSILVAGVKLIVELLKGIVQQFTFIPSKVVALAKQIPTAVTNGASAIGDVGKKIIQNLWDGISSFASWIKTKAKSIGTKVVDGIKSGITNLANIGINIVKGLWKGAGSMVSWAVSKFKGLGKSILNGIKGALGISSPSKEFAKVGRWSVLGLVKGIEDNANLVENATANLVRIPYMGMSMAMDGAYEYGTTASYTIDVPLYINGREFARATASDMSTAINTRETRMSRQRGIR